MRQLPAVGLLVLTTLVVPSLGAQAARARSAVVPRVTTTTGVVSGLTAESGVRMFRGIPFAAPPVGSLRWRPPQPAARWNGVRDATRFAAQCMQGRIYDDMMFRNSATSEDCLYLNVWTPRGMEGRRLPVLVYIYGGGFQAGDGSEFRYDGESMATRGIVVVTMNYRLGVFGFLAHPELTAESPNKASGNYGLMDQWAALHWVHDNIAAFGGDPAQVTIAGESAGSFSVSAQMVSPLARGLFARAIGESGAFMSATPREGAEANGVAFGKLVRASTLAELRALSAWELLIATSGRPGVPSFWPIVDGWFIPESPAAIYAAGRQARVPLLAGWNSQEGSWRAYLRTTPTSDSARGVFTRLYGERAGDAMRVYPIATDAQAEQSLTDLSGDQFIGYSTWAWLEAHAKTSGQPIYRYYYAHPRPAPSDAKPGDVIPKGAVHSAEIEYAMGNLATNHVYPWTADDHAVSATMQAYFANFIKTGDPNAVGLPRWPTGGVDAGGVAMRMRIDVVPKAEEEPRGRYLFLESVGGTGRR